MIVMSSKPPSGLYHFVSSKGHTFAENLAELTLAFPAYPHGITWKRSSGKKTGTIASKDPIGDATRFAALASKGYVSEALLPNGYVRELVDGSHITLRTTSHSDGSPAVTLNIATDKKVIKIHFVPEGGKRNNG